MIRDTLPDLEQVFQISTSQAGRTRAVTMKASEWNVMALVDGHRSINQICETSPLGRHDTLNRIAQLKLAGLLEAAENRALPADNTNLEKMIAGLSRQLEEYLTQKTRTVTTGRAVTRTLIEEAVSESN